MRRTAKESLNASHNEIQHAEQALWKKRLRRLSLLETHVRSDEVTKEAMKLRRMLGRCEKALKDSGNENAKLSDEVFRLARIDDTELLSMHVPWWIRFPKSYKLVLYAGFGVGAFVLIRVHGSDAVRAAKHFFVWAREHLFAPMLSIAQQMFFKTPNEESKRLHDWEAVQDAKASLENMINNHAERTGAVGARSLSLVSKSYEQEIQKPIEGIVRGNLLELALIQGQYLKTELLEALLVIDTLLEENKFNTQLVVLAPAILVLGGLFSGVRAVYYRLVDDSNSKAAMDISLREHILELSCIVNSLSTIKESDDLDEAEGRVVELILELEDLFRRARRHFPHVRGILEHILLRRNLSVQARAQLCNQLLLIVIGR